LASISSPAPRDEAPDFAWLEIDQLLLKNKTRPAAVFALAGDAAYAANPGFRNLAARYEEILAAYRARPFVAADDNAAEAASRAPDEIKGLSLNYQARLARLAASDLDAAWTPGIALEDKEAALGPFAGCSAVMPGITGTRVTGTPYETQ
jgi:adenylate cyclase